MFPRTSQDVGPTEHWQEKESMSQTDTMLDRLTAIVGADHVLTDEAATRPYRTGYRSGSGDVLAVVHPGTLVALWQCTRAVPWRPGR